MSIIFDFPRKSPYLIMFDTFCVLENILTDPTYYFGLLKNPKELQKTKSFLSKTHTQVVGGEGVLFTDSKETYYWCIFVRNEDIDCLDIGESSFNLSQYS